MQTTRINQTTLVHNVIAMNNDAEFTDGDGKDMALEVFGYDWYAVEELTSSEKAIAKWNGHTWEGVPNEHLQSIVEERAA